MDQFRVLLWTGWTIQAVSPLVPVVAVLIHFQSMRFLSFSWMRRLTVLLVLQLAVNWAMLGMAMNKIHNAWLADLAHLPEAMLPLWVLAGLDAQETPRPAFIASAGAILLSAAWNANQVGLSARWLMAETTASLALLALCLWQFKGLVARTDQHSFWSQPAFWLLGTWILDHAIMLMFYPMQNLFIHQLSRTWILVPWLVRFTIGLVLNCTISRTYLCQKTNSY